MGMGEGAVGLGLSPFLERGLAEEQGTFFFLL